MPVNKNNYEEYFLLYIDNELGAADRAAVQDFVKQYPELGAELDMLGQSVFVPDENIGFENKEVLYREEKRRAIIFFPWWMKTAVAAAIILFLGAGGWWYMNKKSSEGNVPKQEMTKTKEPEIPAVPKIEIIAKTSPEIKEKPVIIASSITHHAKIRSGKTTPARSVLTVEDKMREENIVMRETPNIVHTTVPINDNIDTGNEKINIPVQARDIASNESTPISTTIRYADTENLSGDNKIYFANTSFSKKNNLRVVFRKASRIIDRITTLQ